MPLAFVTSFEFHLHYTCIPPSSLPVINVSIRPISQLSICQAYINNTPPMHNIKDLISRILPLVSYSLSPYLCLLYKKVHQMKIKLTITCFNWQNCPGHSPWMHSPRRTRKRGHNPKVYARCKTRWDLLVKQIVKSSCGLADTSQKLKSPKAFPIEDNHYDLPIEFNWPAGPRRQRAGEDGVITIAMRSQLVNKFPLLGTQKYIGVCPIETNTKSTEHHAKFDVKTCQVKYYDSHHTSFLLSEVSPQNYPSFPLAHLSLPRISASLSIFNRMDKCSNQCPNCMGLYNKHKDNFSSRQHYHEAHSMQTQAPLLIPVVNRPLNQKSPSPPPLMPTQTSQINSHTTFLTHKPAPLPPSALGR
ncbi:hypothetical protein VP01_2180g1 [Puccinia sorghi]|uniref:Uncharacterized protein n=1 Tax=Puccinia sorghi TaxID=27349 RepID=A0A0L6V9A5_9BASI|nr:hypothetical protein VP01_2180g1 [Puccinia sorghi]